MAIKMEQVAKQAQVSLKTVSRVVNNESGVNSETRDKVLEVIKELGYVPHSSARQLARGHAGVIGLVLPNIPSPYSNVILGAILDQSNEAGFHVLVQPYPETKTDRLIKLLLSGQIDGIIIGATQEDPCILVKDLESYHLPYVLIQPNFSVTQSKTMPVVNITDQQGALEMTTHLLDLGHKKIGFITCPLNYTYSKERLLGYQAALKKGGVDLGQQLIVEGDGNLRSGYNGTKSLLMQADKPSAIFASNDNMAIGAAYAAWEMGLHVPNDLSIVGFDDIPLAEQLIPPLTTVHHPMKEVGKTAVDMLLSYIQDTIPSISAQLLPTRLIIRQSCARASKH